MSAPITQANKPMRMAAFSTEEALRVPDGMALAGEKTRFAKWDISASESLRLGPLGPRQTSFTFNRKSIFVCRIAVTRVTEQVNGVR